MRSYRLPKTTIFVAFFQKFLQHTFPDMAKGAGDGPSVDGVKIFSFNVQRPVYSLYGLLTL